MRANKQDSDEKMMQFTEEFKAMIAVIKNQINTLTSATTVIKNHINIFISSLTKKDPPKPPSPTTMVPANTRNPPLDGGYSTKNGGMWTLKHEISSPKFYELLIKTELK